MQALERLSKEKTETLASLEDSRNTNDKLQSEVSGSGCPLPATSGGLFLRQVWPWVHSSSVRGSSSAVKPHVLPSMEGQPRLCSFPRLSSDRAVGRSA